MIELILVIEQFKAFLSIDLFQESRHPVSAAEDLVEFLVSESDQRVLFDRTAVIDLFDIGPHDRTEAHRTWLSCRIKDTAFQIVRPEVLSGFPDRLYLAVCRRIIVDEDSVVSFSNDLAVSFMYLFTMILPCFVAL